MTKYLIIPEGDGDDLANALLFDGMVLSALRTGVRYTCRRMSGPSGAFRSATDTAGVSAPFAPPGGFMPVDWTLGSRAEGIVLELRALPVAWPEISAVQYSTDGGTIWTGLAGTGPGVHVLHLDAARDHMIAIRAVNAFGAGPVSETRLVAGTGSGTEGTTVRVSAGAQSYDLVLPEGVSTLTINGLSYEVDPAEIIGKPPLILDDARVDVAPAQMQVGGRITYAPGPYLYDPAGGEVVFGFVTVRNGADRSRSDSYTVTALDLSIGFSVRQVVVNAHGAGTRLTPLVSPPVHDAVPLRFDGTRSLYGTGLLSGAQTDIVMSMTFTTPKITDGGGLVWITDASGRDALYVQLFNNGTVLFCAQEPSTEIVFDGGDLFLLRDIAQPLDAEERITVVASMSQTQAKRVVLRNGVPIHSLTKTNLAPYALQLDGGVYVGRSKWNGHVVTDMYDLRIWTGVAGLDALDIADPDVQALFISSDGQVSNPEMANAVLGTPALWMPTDAAQAGKMVNLGSGGGFSNKTGEFA